MCKHHQKLQKFYFQSQFLYVKNGPNLSNFFLIEQYHFFVIEIFWHLQFLKQFIFLNDVQFLTTAMHVCKRPKLFFTIVFIGFEHTLPNKWACPFIRQVRVKDGPVKCAKVWDKSVVILYYLHEGILEIKQLVAKSFWNWYVTLCIVCKNFFIPSYFCQSVKNCTITSVKQRKCRLLCIVLTLASIKACAGQNSKQKIHIIHICCSIKHNKTSVVWSSISILVSLKSVQVMVRLHIFRTFSFLAKMLSFLCMKISEKYASGP